MGLLCTGETFNCNRGYTQTCNNLYRWDSDIHPSRSWFSLVLPRWCVSCSLHIAPFVNARHCRYWGYIPGLAVRCCTRRGHKRQYSNWRTRWGKYHQSQYCLLRFASASPIPSFHILDLDSADIIPLVKMLRFAVPMSSPQMIKMFRFFWLPPLLSLFELRPAIPVGAGHRLCRAHGASSKKVPASAIKA